MEMNFYKRWVWWWYLNLFIPKRLWYCDFHKDTVIVVPARVMEDVFRGYNTDTRIGMTPERISPHGYCSGRRSLIFSSHPAYRDGRKLRASHGIVGDLSDFETFRQLFPIQRRALFIPPPNFMRDAGRLMGDLNNPADFPQVLSYAEELCQ